METTHEDVQIKPGSAGRKVAVCTALACYWACIFSTLMSPSMLVGMPADEGQIIRVVAAFGIAAGLLLQFAASSRFAIADSKVLSIVVIAFPVLLCGCLLLAPDALGFAGKAILAFACTATSSLLLCNICAYIATFPHRDAVCITCIASSLGALAALGIELIGMPASAFVIPALVLLSVALLWFARLRRDYDETPAREVMRGLRGYRALLAYMFLYSTAFGFMVNTAAAIDSAGSGISLFLGAICIPGITLFGLILLGRQRFDLEYFMRFLAGALIIGLVPMVFLEGMADFACVLVLVVAFGLFDISSIISLYEIIRENDLPHLSTFALGRFFAELGIPVGWSLALILRAAFPAHPNATTIAAFIVAGAMVLMLALTNRRTPDAAPEGKTDLLDSSSSENPYFDFPRAVESLADEAALSARENEVFGLLARGRTPKRISEMLVISESTAKSHAYRIYQKLGVHSQQDLLDLVESRQQALAANRWNLME